MRRFWIASATGLFLLTSYAAAQFTIGDNLEHLPAVHVEQTNVALSSKPISKQTRFEMIRLMVAEFAYARIPIPKGEKGLTLQANGPLTPTGPELNDILMRMGRVAKPGERIQITGIEFKNNTIRFEINGGAKKKEKWYQRIEAGGNGGSIPIAPQAKNVNGALLTLTFDKFVPEMGAQEIHELLSPLFDFTIKSPTQAFADSLPPKTKAAVLEHRALVGMNHEMINAAIGSPSHKDRESENGVAYEEWIYGEPPAEVQFIRFVGDEVVRIEVVSPGQAPVIRTAREVDLPIKSADQQEAKVRPTPGKPQKPPSLRRDGEDEPEANANDMEKERRKLEIPQNGGDPNGVPEGIPSPSPTPQ